MLLFVIGQIMGTHGLKGELKVKQLTDFNERFDIGNKVYIKDKIDKVELEIDGYRQTNKGLLIHFKHYETIKDVEHLVGETLYITEKEQTELEENAFYYHQIIGCNVQTIDGENLGVVESILAPGANDVWVVNDGNGKEILIPYIEDVVIDVNIAKKLIKIKLLEGLIE